MCVGGPNPLVVPLESAQASRARRTQLWFSQAGVQGILGKGEGEGEGEGGGEEEGRGEEEELERTVAAFKQKGGQLWEREGGRKRKTDTSREWEDAPCSCVYLYSSNACVHTVPSAFCHCLPVTSNYINSVSQLSHMTGTFFYKISTS